MALSSSFTSPLTPTTLQTILSIYENAHKDVVHVTLQKPPPPFPTETYSVTHALSDLSADPHNDGHTIPFHLTNQVSIADNKNQISVSDHKNPFLLSDMQFDSKFRYPNPCTLRPTGIFAIPRPTESDHPLLVQALFDSFMSVAPDLAVRVPNVRPVSVPMRLYFEICLKYAGKVDAEDVWETRKLLERFRNICYGLDGLVGLDELFEKGKKEKEKLSKLLALQENVRMAVWKEKRGRTIPSDGLMDAKCFFLPREGLVMNSVKQVCLFLFYSGMKMPVIASPNVAITHSNSDPHQKSISHDISRFSAGYETQMLQAMHKEFLSQVLVHAQRFRLAADNKEITLQNLAIAAAAKDRNNQMKATKERMRALKENNMEAYMNLLKEQADERLQSLLSQTDEFLAKLSSLIKNEQSKKATDVGLSAISRSSNSVANSSADYFNLVHGLKEKIEVQPQMLTGGQLKQYQLEGLEWMVSLFNSNMNGILADEMGLGKTIQTVALVAYLMETKKVNEPFLVIAPLSTLSNWSNEFSRWTPSIRVINYIGKQVNRNQMWKETVQPLMFDVLLTSYDFIIHAKERPRLRNIKWAYIVIDEGHRMKNSESKLATTLQTQYSSAHRLILTGTPLQNSLNELWALFNFLLPTVFNSADNFDSWFNKPFENAGIDDNVDIKEEEKLLIIHRLHQVLRPFILRRLKVDVATQLPEKKECVLKCQLSAWQKVLYNQISQRLLREYDPTSGKAMTRTLKHSMMQLRKCCNHPYVFHNNMDDSETFVTDEIVRSSGKFELLDRLLPKLKRTNHRVSLCLLCRSI